MTLNNQALREELLNPANGSNNHLRKLALSLLDDLDGKEGRIKELYSQRALAFMACNRWRDKFDEAESKLEAAEKRIADLGRHLKSAHAFIENTEAFGYEAASGILSCGDSEWDVDASKESLRATGIKIKGE